MKHALILILFTVVFLTPVPCPAESGSGEVCKTGAENEHLVQPGKGEGDPEWERAWFNYLISLYHGWADDCAKLASTSREASAKVATGVVDSARRLKSETRMKILPAGSSNIPTPLSDLQQSGAEMHQDDAPLSRDIAPGAVLRIEKDKERPWWIELGGRWVGESKTEGYLHSTDNLSIFHLSGGIALQDRVSLLGGVETVYGNNSFPDSESDFAEEDPEGPSRSFFLNLQIRY